MQKRVEQLILKISEDQGLPEFVVRAIIESQFQCAREAAKEGEAGNPSSFKNIRFKHLGLLAAKPMRITKINNVANKHKNDGTSI